MKISKYIWFLMAAMLFASCSDWFDITSGNEIREKDHYSTDTGYGQAVIGCYETMADISCYGLSLYDMPEIMVNGYRTIAEVMDAGYLQRHQFAQKGPKQKILGLWNSSYNVIANANEALKNMEGAENRMNEINYHVFKGELYAIRALVHFNLLRFFGYGNWAKRKAELDDKFTIPYVTVVNKDIQPQSTGAQVIANILKDLTEAELLLKDYDPVCGVHDASYYKEVNEDGWYDYRNFHLNYYAVKALKAQVYLWHGEIDKAEAEAMAVINAIGKGKRLTLAKQPTFILKLMTVSEVNEPNYSMVNETLFGLSVHQLGMRVNSFFNPNYLDGASGVYLLKEDFAEELYNNSNTDFRFTKLLFHNISSTPTGYVPLKYYQSVGNNSYFADKINVIRLPEVYYIAAECHAEKGNTAEALRLLNAFRETRGLYEPLAGMTSEEIKTEIGKEYQREFMGEGGAYFYFKRVGAENTPAKMGMTDADYVLPYPDYELQSGRVQ